MEVAPESSPLLSAALGLGALLAAIGEVTGYVLGGGACERHRLWAELHRAEMVRPSDRIVFDPERV
jgi:hypothetical protein